MPDLASKHILLGMTGGVAAYKVAELVRRLQDEGATVQVVMTESATQFITPVTMQALTGRPVYTSAWDARVANNMPHIDLSREADVIVIAPASADFMAKVAHGLADDLLSTLVLARKVPLLMAPAMNVEMWANAATQRNVATLRGDGVGLLGPAVGDQACGEVGSGRMLEPHELLAEITAHFQPKVLAGKRVLITAGPTFEPIDPVRGITNVSSGKMGYAIARAAWEAGASVHLVSGPTALAAPHGVSRVNVQTAREMLAAVQAEADGSDIFISVAAVSDWRVDNAAASKLKKSEGSVPALQFVENPDILATVAAAGKAKGKPYCVGFAAETDHIEQYAREKRAKKGVPLLVANNARSAMGADANTLWLFDDAGVTALPELPKLSAARRLVGEIARRL
ncbi:phosphopantothenate synthase [beta proteobacterium AAP99]|nr:phosphopantothenate synthase [beta proteobacterium AAP99]